MKIIVKPGTYLAIGVSVILVIGMLIFQDRPDAISPEILQKLKIQKTLVREDFQKTFFPVSFTPKKETQVILGEVANGWQDWSQITDAIITYSRDINIGPEATQRVDFQLRQGDFFLGRELYFEPGRYRISVRVRASEPILVRLGLCKDYKNRTFVASQTATIGPSWSELTLESQAEKNHYFIVIGSRHPKASLWVSSFQVTPI